MSTSNHVIKAKICEQAERYEDMATEMKEAVEEKKTLTTEERNYLSVAYKNVVGARRSAYRVLSSVLERDRDDADKKKIIEDYRQTIKDELFKYCQDLLVLINDTLLKNIDGDPTNSVEQEVFYLKMVGDYYRYMAEIKDDGENAESTQNKLNSEEAYTKAKEAASKSLNSTHPIRLGLALNFSVFYYEIMDKKEEACKLAKEAFDTAISDLDTVQEDSYKDSTLIMQLLRDNLTLWTSSESDDQ